MLAENIELNKKGILTDFDNNKHLLVTFGGISQGLGIPAFEFFNSISGIKCDKIFLRDFNQAWYQKGVDSELDHLDKIALYLREIIDAKGYKKICFIGNSMGGYASILFGIQLNIDCVIAFAPQTYINKTNRVINFDFRWKEQLKEVYDFKKQRKEVFDLKRFCRLSKNTETEIHIYYSLNHRLDKGHAERLRPIKNVILHPLEEGGHSVVKTIRNRGELPIICKRALGL